VDAITLRNTIFIIGAIIMAIEQGLRSAPEFRSRLPRFIASERWNFAPLILMIAAGIIWVVRTVETPKPELSAKPSTIVAPPGVTDGQQWFRVSNADKWKIAKAIRDAKFKELHFQIVRYDTPQCEVLGQDLEEIFEASGAIPMFPPGAPISGNLQKGIVLHGQQSEPGMTLQNILTPALKYSVGRDINAQYPSYLTIAIGNPPES
jgi:hypothetical protein